MAGLWDKFREGVRNSVDNSDDQKLFLHLVQDLNYPEDAASFIVQKAKQTGQLNTQLPTFQASGMEGNRPAPTPGQPGQTATPNTAPLPFNAVPNRPVALPPVPDIPQRSTLQNFQPKREDQLLMMNASNPPKTPQEVMASMIPIPPNMGNVKTITYDKPDQTEAKNEARQAALEAKEEARKSAADIKEQARQDKLETNARRSYETAFSPRFGGRSAGVENMKVDAAIHARSLIEASRDPKTGEINLNQITTPELAQSLATIISNGAAPNLEQFRSMTPQSLQADVMRKIGYVLGRPVSILTPEWTKQLVHQLDRQGTVAEDNRNTYLKQVRLPFGLNAQTKKDLEDEYASKGNSYREVFGIPKTEGGHVGMNKNSEQQTDIDGAKEAISKKLITKQEALKRLKKKYGDNVKFDL